MKRLFILLLATVPTTACATISNEEIKPIGMYSSPAQAEVWIDGTMRGTTPVSLELDNQTGHYVTFRKEGHSDVVCLIQSGVEGWWILVDFIPFFYFAWPVDSVTGDWKELAGDACNVALPPVPENAEPGPSLVRMANRAESPGGGRRVRLTTNSGVLIGRIAGESANGFDLALDGFDYAIHEGLSYHVPRSEIVGMDESLGTRRPWKLAVWNSFWWGTTAAYFADHQRDSARNFAIGFFLGGGLTLALGEALIDDERWEPIPVDSTEPAFSPFIEFFEGYRGRSAAVVGVRLRF